MYAIKSFSPHFFSQVKTVFKLDFFSYYIFIAASLQRDRREPADEANGLGQ